MIGTLVCDCGGIEHLIALGCMGSIYAAHLVAAVSAGTALARSAATI